MVKNKGTAYSFMPPISSVCWAAFGFLIFLLPLGGFAQFTISGRVLNQANTKPVSNASVFLSNASVGTQTADNGTFTLYNAKPGKYELIISVVGFETYHQTVMVNSNISLPDILIYVKTIALKEVSIRPVDDPERERNYNIFKDEFLGTSDLAKDCKILNPEALDLNYDKKKSVLTASSVDFLMIENQALGYRVKYLLTNFTKDNNTEKLHFEGPVLFEKIKGTPSQERRWQRKRQEVYEGSEMHFLRSVASARIKEEGFQVLQWMKYFNPLRPPDSVITAKIRLYKSLKATNSSSRDSLSYWVKKEALPKAIQQLMPFPLTSADVLTATDQPGIYALGCDTSFLHLTYDKNGHFPVKARLEHLDYASNTQTTIIKFNAPYAFFDNNGWVTDSNSLTLFGVWARNRVAELLPVDYESVPVNDTNIDSMRVFKNIFSTLNTFLAVHTNEKAYLHFDKPYYAAGDTIYFKAYLTLGDRHELSKISGVLHVDLINNHNHVDHSISLLIENGTAFGDFALPDSLQGGNYRVRAYTQWMRNAGETTFFNQTLPICAVKGASVFPRIMKQQTLMRDNPIDIQFFPEGGSLVAGIRSKVAFKATGANGLGVAVKGVVADDNNKPVCTFASSHLGMGYFYLTVAEAKTYNATFTYDGGNQITVQLPTPTKQGVVLSIVGDAPEKVSVSIQASKASYNETKNKAYCLIVYSGGIASAYMCRLSSHAVTTDIIKSELHTGIARITLFSPAGEPLSERLVFIQNNDGLTVAASSNKPLYHTREKVNIKLHVIDKNREPAIGHFSISVTDENRVQPDENTGGTIESYLLLSSWLNGYVEKPNYYFINQSDQTKADLDVLMLTQGFSRFEWKEVLKNIPLSISWQPENGLELAGRVTTPSGQPVPNGEITLVSTKESLYKNSVTDMNGNFIFKGLYLTDTSLLVLRARKENKGSNVKIAINNPGYPNPSFLKFDDDGVAVISQEAGALMKNKYNDDQFNITAKNGIRLKQIDIKGYKPPKRPELIHSANLNGAGHADHIIMGDQLQGCVRLKDCLNGKIPGAIFKNGYLYLFRTRASLDPSGQHSPPPMVIYVDGARLNQSSNAFDVINPNDIYSIEVLESGGYLALYGTDAPGGALIITSKYGGEHYGNASPNSPQLGLVIYPFNGFYKAREFYSPKYEHPDDNPTRKDLRSTIYWNPELLTDKDGNASFEYYNADGTGSYRLVIEGIDEKGNLGRQVYRYKVQ